MATVKQNKTVSTQDGAGNETKQKTLKEAFADLKSKPFIADTLGYVKAHPYMSTGLGLGATANIAGLFDNDKVGGQLLGGALGGIATIPFQMTPQGRVLAAMAGGTLGSLYDKLAAKKEQEYQQERY